MTIFVSLWSILLIFLEYSQGGKEFSFAFFPRFVFLVASQNDIISFIFIAIWNDLHELSELYTHSNDVETS